MKKAIALFLIMAMTAAMGLSALAAEPEDPEESALDNQMDVLSAPSGLTLTEDGALLVTDVYHKCVWSLRDGVSTRITGAETVPDRNGEPMGGYFDSSLEDAVFQEPWAIVPFLDGWAVSDPGNKAVRLVREKNVETVNARTYDRSIPTSTMGVTFERPTGLAVDNGGNLYVADTGSGVILRITSYGVASVYCRDLNAPTGLCWYKGTLYVAETGAHRVVRIIQSRPQLVAGCGEQGYEDGPAKDAAFSSPTGVAVDKNGVIYVADTANAAVRRIRNGEVDTLLAPPDGDLSMAPISPRGLLVRGGELLVCDPYSRNLLAVPLD